MEGLLSTGPTPSSSDNFHFLQVLPARMLSRGHCHGRPHSLPGAGAQEVTESWSGHGCGHGCGDGRGDGCGHGHGDGYADGYGDVYGDGPAYWNCSVLEYRTVNYTTV